MGTEDYVSPYDGLIYNGTKYYLSADEVHAYWGAYNGCDSLPTVTEIENTNTSDSSTVERHAWVNEDDCIIMEQLKVIGGGHDWPGSFGNMDINATQEIWNFVSRFDIDGVLICDTVSIVATTNINESIKLKSEIKVYPNPFKDEIQIESNFGGTKAFEIYSIVGELILKGILNANSKTINLTDLAPNVYVLKINNQTLKLIKTE